MAKVALARIQLATLSSTVDPMSWSFVFQSAVATDFSSVTPLFTALHNFLNQVGDITGTVNAVGHYLPPVVDGGAGHTTFSLYDITGHLDGTPHGSPVAVATDQVIPPTVSTVKPVPEGCSAAISFRSDYGTDVEFGPGGTRPRARDRNRVYIPINSNALDFEATTNRVEISAQCMTDFLGALHKLSETIDVSGNAWNLRVWSRKAAAVKLPTEGWMDNRPDYQRRRTDPAPGTRVFAALASV